MSNDEDILLRFNEYDAYILRKILNDINTCAYSICGVTFRVVYFIQMN